jgi:fumarylacetoacetate (FAA) hydrolase
MRAIYNGMPGAQPACHHPRMKLATYQDGSRDGQLVVVSDDLTQAHHASGIATRLQQVLDDWTFLAPQLQDLARTLASGKARHAFPFDPRLCMAPLPRAYRLVDAQGPDAPLPPPLGAELAGDALDGPHRAIPADGAETTLALAVRPVLALGDLPCGAADGQARDGVRLVLLAHHWQQRQGLDGPLWRSSMAFAPVAVTPDALGRAWQRGRLSLSLRSTVADQAEPPSDLVAVDIAATVAELARARAVRSGTLLALPGLAWRGLGAAQQVESDACDALGQSVFGALVQARRED